MLQQRFAKDFERGSLGYQLAFAGEIYGGSPYSIDVLDNDGIPYP
jgi:hypothetical protein